MSSKFSRQTSANKPPAICKKPPEGPTYIPPPITLREIQGYVEYFDPYSPSEGGLVASITLHPTGPPNTWFGSTTQGIYRAQILMTANLQKTHLDYRLDWFVGDLLTDTLFIWNAPAQSWQPFDSGQITPMPQPQHGRIGWHFWM